MIARLARELGGTGAQEFLGAQLNANLRVEHVRGQRADRSAIVEQLLGIFASANNVNERRVPTAVLRFEVSTVVGEYESDVRGLRERDERHALVLGRGTDPPVTEQPQQAARLTISDELRGGVEVISHAALR